MVYSDGTAGKSSVRLATKVESSIGNGSKFEASKEKPFDSSIVSPENV